MNISKVTFNTERSKPSEVCENRYLLSFNEIHREIEHLS